MFFATLSWQLNYSSHQHEHVHLFHSVCQKEWSWRVKGSAHGDGEEEGAWSITSQGRGKCTSYEWYGTFSVSIYVQNERKCLYLNRLCIGNKMEEGYSAIYCCAYFGVGEKYSHSTWAFQHHAHSGLSNTGPLRSRLKLWVIFGIIFMLPFCAHLFPVPLNLFLRDYLIRVEIAVQIAVPFFVLVFLFQSVIFLRSPPFLIHLLTLIYLYAAKKIRY